VKFLQRYEKIRKTKQFQERRLVRIAVVYRALLQNADQLGCIAGLISGHRICWTCGTCVEVRRGALPDVSI
jgi:hypothetical protein